MSGGLEYNQIFFFFFFSVCIVVVAFIYFYNLIYLFIFGWFFVAEHGLFSGCGGWGAAL